MFRLAAFLTLTLPLFAAAQDNTGAAAALGAAALASQANGPLADALGRAVDPPVCCQMMNRCSPGSEGTTTGELRSLCIAASGQPLTGQYCHSDGQCRP